MGSCVSTHSKSSQESAMKARVSFVTKTTTNVAIPPSPIKDKSDILHHYPVKSKSPCSADLGSKDDTFFDSQPWLESDGEDDFVSVNGDSTPIRGNTTVGWIHEPSPKENRKKLSDLFRERVKEDQSDEREESSSNKKFAAAEIDGIVKPTTQSIPSKSADTANGHILMDKVKRNRTTQGCLIGLVSCRSFSERKRRLSPAIVVTEKA